MLKLRERSPSSCLLLFQPPTAQRTIVHVLGIVDVTVFISMICCLMYKYFLKKKILPSLLKDALRH